MKLNSTEPIFIQIAKYFEDQIVQGFLEEETQIPSTTVMAKTYAINPATILKGMNILVDKHIIYKKRGLGMFVSTGAKNIIEAERREMFKTNVIRTLMEEASKLGISKQEIVEQILNWESDNK
ncbi:GntR family transcriptional regulator [Candidatus Epulonipiscium fishelsonii]|uniref:GntR family transcriptional regulator n=1 Tax=Candidatus Epulonipiscium fishelsonii TaxID=77094 RepID=A0ACC8XFU2_9FIRM|nr:GntR family transcriptional regulator [Epulopiscium sp. SCG-B11WGA-EpuloA1]ONI43855.1 GntR family transcriptional regulator [Epulopiscium sp. SCG-B05WGA-EpuloA1]